MLDVYERKSYKTLIGTFPGKSDKEVTGRGSWDENRKIFRMCRRTSGFLTARG